MRSCVRVSDCSTARHIPSEAEVTLRGYTVNTDQHLLPPGHTLRSYISNIFSEQMRGAFKYVFKINIYSARVLSNITF